MEIRERILKSMPTGTLLKVMSLSKELLRTVIVTGVFEEFDPSEIGSLTDADLENLQEVGFNVKRFALTGNDFDLDVMVMSFVGLLKFFPNLTSFELTRTIDVPCCLQVLKYLPKSVTYLKLHNTSFPAVSYIKYLPPLAPQLDRLSLTLIPPLTKYDLVNILQHFSRLDWLDIRGTDFIRPGTAMTIMRYCYNLQTFLFDTEFRVTDSQEWLDLVEFDFQHVHYSDKFYEEIESYRYFTDRLDE